MEATEVLKTSGVVQAVAQHDESRYSVKVGGEWYGGFGTCPAEKGVAYVIEYAMNGRWRNIKSIKEQGEAVSERIDQQRAEIREQVGGPSPSAPFGVRNYQTETGWHEAFITAEENQAIQQVVRERNNQILAECKEDARQHLLSMSVGNAVTPKTVLKLATFLAERRTVHASRVYDDYLTRKINRERGASEAGAGQEAV